MKGVKTVSQETFDNVVGENVREFEMNPTDATEEAIKQFEAQGVDLANIVKEVSVVDGVVLTPTERAVRLVSALRLLTERYPDNAAGTLETALSDVAVECNKGLAHRCLIGAQERITDVLFTLLRAAVSRSDWLLCIAILDTLHSLTDGQPDVFAADDLRFLIDVGGERLADAELGCRLVGVVHNACIKHETNRQTVVSGGLVDLLMRVAETHKDRPSVIKVALQTLRCLTLDDDMRVAFGKAHDNAKMIVSDFAGIKALMKIAKEATIDHAVLVELLATLSNLAVRNEYCQEIVDEGGLEFVVKALMENIENQALVRVGLSVMKTIAGNDAVKEEIVKAGGVDLILSAMNKHQAEPRVSEAACSCLAALALRAPSNCQAIMEAGGCSAIVTALKVHRTELAVQKSACRAIRNLVSRTKHFCGAFLDSGAEELINEGRKLHPKVEDDAKAALRDLGCKVNFQELWTGQRSQMTQ